jgi:hypothetical protein
MFSCSDDSKVNSDDKMLKFTKNTYNKEWPFSVDQIEVFCSGYKEIYCRADNGRIYALNGSAKSASKKIPSIKEVDEIWLEDPKLPGTKISYSDFITEGLKFCDDK